MVWKDKRFFDVTHRLNALMLILLLLVGVPFYWLLIDNDTAESAPKHIDIAELRQLAGSIPGHAPSEVEVEPVAWRNVPQTLFAAGSGFRFVKIYALAFRLPVEGGKAIVIDSGFGTPGAEAIPYSTYDLGAQDRVNAALREAGTILLTHEHLDSMGGITALAARGRLPESLHLTPGQASPDGVPGAARWPVGLEPVPDLDGKAPRAVAPGVVVIPAPDSHTPGSQMIYVRLKDGREFLFTGGIASLAVNWQQMRRRSRLLSEHIAPSNRREVSGWLQAIRALKREVPGLIVVPAHDLGPLLRARAAAAARIGF